MDVSGIVVNDEMEIEVGGGLQIDQFEKAQERCEQRCGAVSLVVVGPGADRSSRGLRHRNGVAPAARRSGRPAARPALRGGELLFRGDQLFMRHEPLTLDP
jgi:hypothetical protein